MFSDDHARPSGDINRLIDGNLRIKGSPGRCLARDAWVSARPSPCLGPDGASFLGTVSLYSSRDWQGSPRSTGREVFCDLCCGLCGGYSPRTKLYCSFLGTHVILLPSLQWEKPQSYLWRRKWQPSPVFLPGDTQEQRGLVGYSPWGQESDTTYLAEFKRRGECYFQAKANLPSSLIKSLFFLHSWELVWLGIELNVGNRTLELWRYCSTKQQATLLLRYLLSVWYPFPL